ncbi:hypothetical protein JCM10207_008684 [Rhodosporidiobolus poonsookiae]
MLYVATSHPPSAQLGALQLAFFPSPPLSTASTSPSPDPQQQLVINKLNRLDFLDVVPTSSSSSPSLSPRLSLPIHGTIADVAAVHLPTHRTASLLLLSSSLVLTLLHSSPTSSPVHTISHTSLAEPFARPAPLQAIRVAPDQSVAVVHAYAGLLRVVPLAKPGEREAVSPRGSKKRRASALDRDSSSALVPSAAAAEDAPTDALPTVDLSSSFNLRLAHLTVLALSFLPSRTSQPLLAILSLSPTSGKKLLSLYFLDVREKELVPASLLPGGRESVEVGDEGAEGVVPFSPPGEGVEGVLVVGEESVVFYPLGTGATKGGDDAEEQGQAKSKGKGKARASDEGASGSGGRRGSKSASSAVAKSKGADEGVVVARLPVSRITAHTFLTPHTLLLSDLYGKLLLLTFSFPSSKLKITVRDLGDAASATALVPLGFGQDGGTVYLPSRFGDSQLVRLNLDLGAAGEGEKMDLDEEKGETLELVESYPALAPVTDAVVLDGGAGAGQGGEDHPILLLSGAYKSGSLRLLRRGVGLDPLAEVDLSPEGDAFEAGAGASAAWAVQTPEGRGVVVLGGAGQGVRLLSVLVGGAEGEEEEEEVEVEELDPADLAPFSASLSSSPAATPTPTLLAANVGPLVVHVTPSGLFYPGGQWQPEGGEKLTAATARGETGRVAVAGERGRVWVLQAEEGGVREVGTTTFDTPVSALSLSSTGSTLAIALWTPSQTVHLVALPSSSSPSSAAGRELEKVASVTLSSTYLIRSVALTTFSSGETLLFCGMGDGALVSYSLSPSASAFDIDAKSAKTVQLGRRPLALTEIGGAEGQGETALLCVSERGTVVTMGTGGRVVYRGINGGDLSAVCALPRSSNNGSASPLLALASPSTLTLGRLRLSSTTSSSGSGTSLDIRTIPLDEDEPRRVAYAPSGEGGGVVAVVCARRDVDRVSGEMSTRGRVRVVECGEWGTRAILDFPPSEEGQSICTVPASFLASASLTSTAGTSLFALGTVRLPSSLPSDSTDGTPASDEPTSGRVVVLRSRPGSQEVEELAALEVGGCPYAVVPLELPSDANKSEGEAYLAVAVNSQVAVVRLSSPGGETKLEVVATWSGAFVALSLSAPADGSGRLVVSDALRSITVLRFSIAHGQAKLAELAKDYRSRYMLGAVALPPPPGGEGEGQGGVERYLGAETDLNFFTVERDPSAGVRDIAQAGTLQVAGGWHKGEMVTKFAKGSFAAPSSTTSTDTPAPITPLYTYTTTAGTIGVVADLDAETGRVLSELERNLRAFAETIGEADGEEEGVEGLRKVGGMGQEAFRTPKLDSTRPTPSSSAAGSGPLGFVDGTFLALFLDLPAAAQEKVLAGRSEHERVRVSGGGGREEVVRLVEECGRVH